MSYAQREPRPLTAEEYLIIERAAPFKSELLHGQIIRMAGASSDHIRINASLGRAVGNRLEGTGCLEMGSDLKVRTSAEGLFAYPALTIVCGEDRCHDTRRDVLINPTVLFEILSPSTASFDRGEKFLLYQEMDSMRDYVLLWQTTPRVEHYARQEEGRWFPTIAVGVESSVTLSAVPIMIPLSEIYRNVVFTPALSLTPDSE